MNGLRSPRPQIDLREALKSPTRPHRGVHTTALFDASVPLFEQAGRGDKAALVKRSQEVVETLEHVGKEQPLTGWIAVQRVAWADRGKLNVHLLELEDFAGTLGATKCAGVIAYVPLHRGAEDAITHIGSLPDSLKVVGFSYSLKGAPERTLLQEDFVAGLRAVAANRLPIELNLEGAAGGAKVLDELLELLATLDDEAAPLQLILSGLAHPDAILDTTNEAGSYMESLSQLGLRPNVALSLAGLPQGEHAAIIKPLIQVASECFGLQQRVIFGSGMSSNNAHAYGTHVEHIPKALRELGARQEDVDAVFAGSAKRLYGL